jgi:hypothetical protein
MGFFHAKKKIQFQAINEYVEAAQSSPTTASSLMPEWYKKLSKYINNTDKPIKALGRKDVKSCVPFRDAMVTGYMYLLPADIEVAISDTGDIDIFHNRQLTFSVVEKRGDINNPTNQGYGMPHPLGTSPIMFAWSAQWGAKTSKADSILVTHPFNRHDLPFVTTSGVIDSGYFSVAGNIPFFIKEGFTGVIPKGTPIAQIIPYERQEWISKETPSNLKEYSLFMTLRDTYLHGFYSRFMRQTKSYK